MKLRKPWMIKLGARLGAGALKLWMKTVRTQTDSMGQQTDPWDPAVKQRYIYALWHEYALAIPAFHSVAPLTVLISQSADGELVAQMCESNGLRTVRGSSTRGGLEAVDELMNLDPDSHVIVVPDGPRGPRREVKRGLIYLAAWTNRPIVPLGIGYRNEWRANSWDRMAIPWPGSMLSVVAGPVVHVPKGLGKAAMEMQRCLVEQHMLTATELAEAWAKGRVSAPQWPASTTAPAA